MYHASGLGSVKDVVGGIFGFCYSAVAFLKRAFTLIAFSPFSTISLLRYMALFFELVSTGASKIKFLSSLRVHTIWRTRKSFMYSPNLVLAF